MDGDGLSDGGFILKIFVKKVYILLNHAYNTSYTYF